MYGIQVSGRLGQRCRLCTYCPAYISRDSVSTGLSVAILTGQESNPKQQVTIFGPCLQWPRAQYDQIPRVTQTQESHRKFVAYFSEGAVAHNPERH